MANLKHYEDKVNDLAAVRTAINLTLDNLSSNPDYDECARFRRDLIERLEKNARSMKTAKAMLELKSKQVATSNVATPDARAEAVAAFAVGDRVKHYDGTTGTLKAINGDLLGILIDGNDLVTWWSRACMTPQPSVAEPTEPKRTLEQRLTSGNAEDRTIERGELQDAIALIQAGKVQPIEGHDYHVMPATAPASVPTSAKSVRGPLTAPQMKLGIYMASHNLCIIARDGHAWIANSEGKSEPMVNRLHYRVIDAFMKNAKAAGYLERKELLRGFRYDLTPEGRAALSATS